MKRFISLLVMTIFVLTSFAQKDVTTFLGIPVDGFRADMRKALIAKGFTPQQVAGEEYFEGEFNGADVNVYIGTNNNKVYRIMVCDQHRLNEANIKIRFNNLVYQFEKNQRYSSLDDYTIPEGEDIGYEMNVHNKNYDALFIQNPDMQKFDTLAFSQQIEQEIRQKYTPEQLENPSEDLQAEIKSLMLSRSMDLLSNKRVWFRIVESYGEYYIAMYYDNEYNKANGEDL